MDPQCIARPSPFEVNGDQSTDGGSVAPNVASETTLHTSVWFQRCYGCYVINPLEGSDCRFTN